jgi:hypothetical protein
MRATYTRTAGVRHLLAAYELGEDKLCGHVKPRKTRARFLEFCRYLRSLYPPPPGSGTRQSRKFRSSYVADAGGSVSEAMHAVSRRRI